MYLPELLQSPHISYLFDLILDMFTRFLSLFPKKLIQFNNKNKKNILMEKKNKKIKHQTFFFGILLFLKVGNSVFF